MERGSIIFRAHAVRRMFERRIGVEDVRHILYEGEVIESYPDDTPFPSRLILGWLDNRPVHVVAADNNEENETVVITTYEPETRLWSRDFRRRKRQ